MMKIVQKYTMKLKKQKIYKKKHAKAMKHINSGVARHGALGHPPLEFDASFFSGLTQSCKEGGYGGQSYIIDVK